MKLGVFTCLLQNLPLEEALKYVKAHAEEFKIEDIIKNIKKEKQ